MNKMNREILFRGKRVDNGEWVYGYYLVAAGMPFISTFGEKEPIAVIPETVGQFTGLYDKNGNKVFEGDLVIHTSFPRDKQEIRFEDGCFVVNQMALSSYHKSVIEVIGNIHDKEVTK